jgi:hypothetical protein
MADADDCFDCAHQLLCLKPQRMTASAHCAPACTGQTFQAQVLKGNRRGRFCEAGGWVLLNISARQGVSLATSGAGIMEWQQSVFTIRISAAQFEPAICGSDQGHQSCWRISPLITGWMQFSARRRDRLQVRRPRLDEATACE